MYVENINSNCIKHLTIQLYRPQNTAKSASEVRTVKLGIAYHTKSGESKCMTSKW